jgi:hypothetical protein
VLRTVEAMEAHSELCQGAAEGNNASERKHEELSKSVLGGVPRRSELQNASTRIIYRTAAPPSKLFRPREVCAFQDW